MRFNGVPTGIDDHARRSAKLWEQGSKLPLDTGQFNIERRNDVDAQTVSEGHPVLSFGCHSLSLMEGMSAFRPSLPLTA